MRRDGRPARSSRSSALPSSHDRAQKRISGIPVTWLTCLFCGPSHQRRSLSLPTPARRDVKSFNRARKFVAIPDSSGAQPIEERERDQVLIKQQTTSSSSSRSSTYKVRKTRARPALSRSHSFHVSRLISVTSKTNSNSIESFFKRLSQRKKKQADHR
ncbi:hypothetical protein ElyMa_000945600 [Elysia marginata]|uniref:Uncharacterized protein n=1 Tax=Elysia marginata TaxID=1093978 RepID=A0AAV4HFX3_9GAST|nr:hypothetical protein ElyMa_000945600 [Elysia marginata]